MKVKKTFVLLFGFIVFSIGIALLMQVFLLRNQTKLYSSQIKQHSSYLLGDHLRQANDKLTKYCVRYIISNDSLWKQKYYEELKVRQGEIPVSYGWNQTLQDSMLSMGFTNIEFELLHQSIDMAKQLVTIEKRSFYVFDSIMANDKAVESIRITKARESAFKLLNSDAYIKGKLAVIKPITQLEANIKDRTINTRDALAKQGYRFLVFIIGMLILVIIISLFSYWMIRKRLIKQEQQEEEIKERVKEINCLYKVSQITEWAKRLPEEVFTELTQIIPSGHHAPTSTKCQIIYKGDKCGNDIPNHYELIRTAKIEVDNQEIGKIEIFRASLMIKECSLYYNDEQLLLDGVTRMVTSYYERRASMKALEESQQRLIYAFKVANEGIWEWNVGADIVYSPRCFKLLGYDSTTINNDVNVFFQSLVHPQDANLSLFINKEEVVKQGSYRNIIRIKDANGIYKWINIKGEAVEHSNKGSVTRIVGTFADISDRMKQEEKVINAVLETEDHERSRISREIHDGLQQTMSTALLNFEKVRASVTLPEEDLQYKFNTGYNYLKKSIEESRTLAHKLMPKIIADQGLAQAIKSLVDALQNTSGIQFNFYNNIEDFKTRLASEMTLYRITQEAINNVIKYSEASVCSIQIYQHSEFIELSIEDNGIGFDILNTENSFGLNSMKTRAESIGALFQIESQANKGTQIIVELPIK